jgi:hypothetical protein
MDLRQQRDGADRYSYSEPVQRTGANPVSRSVKRSRSEGRTTSKQCDE